MEKDKKPGTDRFGIIRITGQAVIRFLAGWLDTFPLTSPNGEVTLMTVMGAGLRGGGLGSRPKKMYGERLGDGVEYHLMSPTTRR